MFSSIGSGYARFVDASASEAFGRALPADAVSDREPFATRLSRRGDVAWLALGGELDVFTAPILRSALNEAEESEEHSLVVDLRAVSFMDSSGLAVILGAHERASKAGGEPVRLVIRGSEPVEALFRTIGAGEFLHLVDDPGELAGSRES